MVIFYSYVLNYQRVSYSVGSLPDECTQNITAMIITVIVVIVIINSKKDSHSTVEKENNEKSWHRRRRTCLKGTCRPCFP